MFALRLSLTSMKNIDNEQLLNAVRAASIKRGATITFREAKELHLSNASFPSPFLFWRRFSSWNKAIEKAGLIPNRRGRHTHFSELSDELSLNKLKEAAALLGGRVSRNTIGTLTGFPSGKAYERRFGSWGQACRLAGIPVIKGGQWRKNARKRNANLRERFAVLQRDGFACQYCGRTPQDGVQLVVDHILPFSHGGETIIENLVTSCRECNAGKKDVVLSCFAGNKKRQAK